MRRTRSRDHAKPETHFKPQKTPELFLLHLLLLGLLASESFDLGGGGHHDHTSGLGLGFRV